MRIDFAWADVADMDFDRSCEVRGRAPFGRGMDGADSDDLRGEARETVSTWVMDAGEDNTGIAGVDEVAIAVFRCSGKGLEGPDMYGRDEAARGQGRTRPCKR